MTIVTANPPALISRGSRHKVYQQGLEQDQERGELCCPIPPFNCLGLLSNAYRHGACLYVVILPTGELVYEMGQGKAPQAFDFDSISVFRDGNVTRYPL